MPAVLLTGFPGFLGSALVEALLARYPEDMAIACLVQPRYKRLAEARIAAIAQARPAATARLQLLEGDVTLEDLGLGGKGAALQKDVVEVFHLAAAYDLGIPRELGLLVNVRGTAKVLRFAEACPRLTRFQYVSTCYVSGRYPGTFGEGDLVLGQAFNNYYEETKYLAEVAVQERMKAGLPATIYRPSIVVGDSKTGRTQKYDGPYSVLRWILRWRTIAPVPVFGEPRRHIVNVVPRDFVVDALQYLSGLDAAVGKVYHLSDPQPVSVQEMYGAIARATGRHLVHVPLPKPLLKAALRYVRRGRFAAGVDYFDHPTRYRCDNTLRDLAGTAIRCPAFETYLPQLVAYLRAHPEVASTPMF